MPTYTKAKPSMVSMEDALKIVTRLRLNPKDFKIWRYKYWNLRVSAPKRFTSPTRGESACCYLTFKEYLQLALKIGMTSPDQIGKQSHLFQMGRKKDLGHYTKTNCRFITMQVNAKERVANGGHERGMAKKRGRTKETHEYLVRQSNKVRGRTKENDFGKFMTSLKLTGRERPPEVFETSIKAFRVTSPKDKTYVSRNVSGFCRQHGLDQGCMSRVLSGKQSSHNGWTGRYKD